MTLTLPLVDLLVLFAGIAVAVLAIGLWLGSAFLTPPPRRRPCLRAHILDTPLDLLPGQVREYGVDGLTSADRPTLVGRTS